MDENMKEIFAEGKLSKKATCKENLHVQSEAECLTDDKELKMIEQKETKRFPKKKGRKNG